MLFHTPHECNFYLPELGGFLTLQLRNSDRIVVAMKLISNRIVLTILPSSGQKWENLFCCVFLTHITSLIISSAHGKVSIGASQMKSLYDSDWIMRAS